MVLQSIAQKQHKLCPSGQWSQLVTPRHTFDHLVPSETSWPHIAAVGQQVFAALGGTGTSKMGICEMIGGCVTVTNTIFEDC